jgi:hypothetical protein
MKMRLVKAISLDPIIGDEQVGGTYSKSIYD